MLARSSIASHCYVLQPTATHPCRTITAEPALLRIFLLPTLWLLLGCTNETAPISHVYPPSHLLSHPARCIMASSVESCADLCRHQVVPSQLTSSHPMSGQSTRLCERRHHLTARRTPSARLGTALLLASPSSVLNGNVLTVAHRAISSFTSPSALFLFPHPHLTSNRAVLDHCIIPAVHIHPDAGV